MNARMIILVILCLEVSSALLVAMILVSQGKPWLGIWIGALMLGLPFVLIPIVMQVMSRISGWRRLAAEYPAMPPVPGAAKPKLTSIALRSPLMSYNNIVEWTADDDHLHLSLPPIFNTGHPPLSIPWVAVQSIEPARLGAVRLRLADTSLWLPEKCVRREIELRSQLETLDEPLQPGRGSNHAEHAESELRR